MFLAQAVALQRAISHIASSKFCRQSFFQRKLDYHFYFLFLYFRIWENYGTQIVVNTDNITTRVGCEKLFKAALQLGPIGGIFNLAVALRDSILENQCVEKYVECILPKGTATEYFGKISL